MTKLAAQPNNSHRPKSWEWLETIDEDGRKRHSAKDGWVVLVERLNVVDIYVMGSVCEDYLETRNDDFHSVPEAKSWVQSAWGRSL